MSNRSAVLDSGIEFTFQDNVNISVFRLLLVYRLLCQNTSLTLHALNEALTNHPSVQRSLTNETLGHYLNTLQYFGCQITRFLENGDVSYRLGDHPLKPMVHKDEHHALTHLCNQVSKQPLAKLSQRIYFLIQNVCSNTNIPFFHRDGSFLNPANIQGLTAESMALLERCVSYCHDGQVLEICHTLSPQEETLLMEPIDVILRRGVLYLLGINTRSRKKLHLPIRSIQSVRQLPQRASFYSAKTMVTFELTDKLAQNYRPYPGEQLEPTEQGLLVKHTTDDIDQLMLRLMKYGTQCRVLSPEPLKQSLFKHLDALAKIAKQHPKECLV